MCVVDERLLPASIRWRRFGGGKNKCRKKDRKQNFLPLLASTIIVQYRTNTKEEHITRTLEGTPIYLCIVCTRYDTGMCNTYNIHTGAFHTPQPVAKEEDPTLAIIYVCKFVQYY